VKYKAKSNTNPENYAQKQLMWFGKKNTN